MPAFCLVGGYLEDLPGASLHHHDRLVQAIDDAVPKGGGRGEEGGVGVWGGRVRVCVEQ